MRFCAFLMMSIELLRQERSFEIVIPKNFTELACKTSAPSTKRGWMGLTPANQSLNVLSIHRLISIVDTTNNSGVIRELNNANRLVTRYTVVCKKSEKERRKHAALWGISVKNNRFGERVVDLDRLRPDRYQCYTPMFVLALGLSPRLIPLARTSTHSF